MIERMSPMWDTRAAVTTQPKQIQDIVEEGRKRASIVAKETMKEVKDAMKI